MQQVVNKLLMFYATGFGTGLLKPMPGTWGTLPGVPIAYLMQKLSIEYALLVYFFLVLLAFYAAEVRGRAVEDWDHPSIVCDEIVGVIPLLWYVPFGIHWFWGFILFRFLDIIKPFPISWVDSHISGPFGCLLDDLLAGAAAILFVVCLSFWVG